MTRIIASGLLLLASGCAALAPPPAPVVVPFADGSNWMLNEPLRYQLGSTEHEIVVPDGFVTDFASVPRIAWAVMSPVDRHGRAGIIHDWLYWDQGCTREQADKIMLYAMRESKVDSTKRNLIYRALRLAGESAWENNAEMRSLGRPREIGVAYRPLPADAIWPGYREYLYKQGERAAPHGSDREAPGYCAAVDSLPESE